MTTKNKSEWIPISECKDGVLYKIWSRNAKYGVWRTQQQGFEYARSKFHDLYLDIEYHWDTGAPFGTAKPYEEIGLAPTENLLEYLKSLTWDKDGKYIA